MLNDNLFTVNPANIYNTKICMSKKLENNKINNLSISLADHCNHSCARCGVYSPLAKERFPDEEKILKSLTYLSKITNSDIEMITVMGGEPLLNKRISFYLREIRNLFKNSLIIIVTNGILIPNMDEEFWNTLKENNIFITVSKYYENHVLYEKIQETIEKFEITNFSYSKVPYFECVLFTENKLSMNYSHTKEEGFDLCPHKYCSIYLEEDIIYPCAPTAYVHRLNCFFNKDFPSGEGISIYGKTFNEIMNDLKKPCNLCKCCDPTTFDKYYLPAKATFNEEDWIRE